MIAIQNLNAGVSVDIKCFIFSDKPAPKHCPLTMPLVLVQRYWGTIVLGWTTLDELASAFGDRWALEYWTEHYHWRNDFARMSPTGTEILVCMMIPQVIL